ncbi:MAG: addiction module protein [Gemmatimonadota bacterium]
MAGARSPPGVRSTPSAAPDGTPRRSGHSSPRPRSRGSPGSNRSVLDFRQLSVDERLRLIEEIWESIVEETEGASDAIPLAEEQIVELERRLAEHERNPASAIPWEKAIERIRGGLRQAREDKSP